jgi:hypothetical protein
LAWQGQNSLSVSLSATVADSQFPSLVPIVTEDIESEALATLVVNKVRGSPKVAAIKALASATGGAAAGRGAHRTGPVEGGDVADDVHDLDRARPHFVRRGAKPVVAGMNPTGPEARSTWP